MPRQSTVTDIRLNNIITCLAPALPLLKELNDTFGAPFVQTILNTTVSLISGVQKVKRSKNECIQLMENIHKVLYTLISLHITSETKGFLPPAILNDVGRFTETLHKIHMFVEMQQDGNKIRHFLRQNEISNMLKSCREGVQEALDVFKIDTTIFDSITEMHKTTEIMHKELLEFISTLPDETTSDKLSSIYQYYNGSQHSSNSFSMLPSQPKIFHGRESELQDIIKILNEDSPRIAILGAGGMGKTSLARAALHHPDISATYENRLFVTCDSATNSIGIAALVGAHLGLNPGKDLTKPVLQYLSGKSFSLLILDNLETAWEPMESRTGVEEFLSLLADIKHLALIITMRGAERPAKVRWTRPFPQPLKPLSDAAAWQTFVDIAEDSHKTEDIKQLLRLTDNMPLAVDLIAHLVDYEGCPNVLSRWKTEGTSLLSDGHDKRSSLDASIALSLSSPRMNSAPGAKDLLGLLSILPDGLTDIELVQIKLPIQNILGCKSTLLATSLAHVDENKRLKSLIPIREHVLQFQPPSTQLMEPLRNYFHLLLDLYRRYQGRMEMAAKTEQIKINLGNLHQVLNQGLHPDSPDLLETIACIISLNSFSRLTNHGWLNLMDHIPSILPQLCDYKLEVQFITETLFSGKNWNLVTPPESLVARAISHFKNLNDPALESKFYHAAGYYYTQEHDSRAMSSFERSLALSRASGNTNQHAHTLATIAEIKWRREDYSGSRADAWEAQRLAQVAANFNEQSRALRTYALCCTSLGSYQQSIPQFNRARDMLSLCGFSGGLLDLNIMNSQAEVHLLKSEYVQARQIYTEVLQQTTAEQGRDAYAYSLLNIAQVDVMIDAYKHDVHQSLDKAKAIFKTKTQNRLDMYFCDMITADLHLRDGNTIPAKYIFQKCLNQSLGNDGDGVFYCLERLADISRWEATDFDWSYQWTVVYLGHAKRTQRKLDLHKALQFLGDAFLHNEDEETSHSLFMLALEGLTYMGVHRSRANCMLRLGDIAKRRGQLDEAAQLWKNARLLFELSSQTKPIAQIDARLAMITAPTATMKTPLADPLKVKELQVYTETK